MTPEETFEKLLAARGLGGAQTISVENAKQIFCSHFEHEEQSYRDLDKLYNDHMERCSVDHYRTPIGEIESRLKEGVAIHFPEGCGKTRALLNFVERVSDRSGKVAFIGMRGEQMRLARARRRLADAHPGQFDNIEFFAGDDTPSSFNPLRGHSLVVVDDWWSLKEEFRNYLAENFRVIAAVGTIRYGTEFPIIGQPHRSVMEREIEHRVRERLYEEIRRYTDTQMCPPVMMPMPKGPKT